MAMILANDGMSGAGGGGGGLKKPMYKEFLNVRESRKKADQDAQLLANRIALLEAEERKAWKKIQQTKDRASNVIAVRDEGKERRKRAEAQRKAEMRRQRKETESRYVAKEIERQAKKVGYRYER